MQYMLIIYVSHIIKLIFKKSIQKYMTVFLLVEMIFSYMNQYLQQYFPRIFFVNWSCRKTKGIHCLFLRISLENLLIYNFLMLF